MLLFKAAFENDQT